MPSASSPPHSRHDAAGYNIYEIDGAAGAWQCTAVLRSLRADGDGFVERDDKIQRLTNLLTEKIQNESAQSPGDDAAEATTLKATIADLDRRLARETSR